MQQFFPLPPTGLQSIFGHMIINFRHKGLKNFFETGNKAGIQAKHADRLP